MADIVVYEYERGLIDVTLTYSSQFSTVAKRGTPVLQTDVTRVYFYVKTLLADSAAWLTLTDASASQIEWIDATHGQLRVKLGTTTGGHAADNQPYELRLKLTDGSYLTVDTGMLHVKNSV